jgi:biopolymer transport protein ExbD
MAKKPKEEIHLKKRPKPLPVRYTPNVTPLIDVMFLLLLFFLLTTKFRQEEGAIPGTLPALGKSFASEAAEELPPPINVTINPVGRDNVDASYQVSGVEVSVGNAEELYKDLMGRGKAFSQHEMEKVPVVIKPRSDVRWGFVVEAFNQTYRAKYRCILFAPT